MLTFENFLEQGGSLGDIQSAENGIYGAKITMVRKHLSKNSGKATLFVAVQLDAVDAEATAYLTPKFKSKYQSFIKATSGASFYPNADGVFESVIGTAVDVEVKNEEYEGLLNLSIMRFAPYGTMQ